MEGLLALVAALALAPARQPSSDLLRAADLAGRGRCAEAEPALERLVRIDSSPEAHYFLGFCLLSRFEHERAEVHLRRAVEARSREHLWLHTLAKSLLDRGRTGEAFEVLERAIAIEDRPEYRYARAICAVDLGRLEDAERDLLEAVDSPELRLIDGRGIVDGRAEVLFQLGKLLALRGRDEESIDALAQAVRRDPAHLEARLHLGVVQRRRGELALARRSFESVLAERPSHVAALYGLYRTLSAEGEREAAAAVAERLKPLGSLDDEIRFLLSAADSLERHLDETSSEDELRRSILEKRLALVERLVDAGRTEEALQHLLAARRLEPERSETYLRLAKVFRLLGRGVDAEMAEGIARQLAASGR